MTGHALVLGAAGFMGGHVVPALVRDGWRVRAFDGRRMRRHPTGRPEVERVEGDFANPRDVAGALDGCDTVFHLIGTMLPETSNQDIAGDLESNIKPTLQLLELAARGGVRRIVFASSGGTVYGISEQVPIPETHKTDPQCAYGIHKLAIEKYLALYRATTGLDYRILRVANAFGEGQESVTRQGVVAVFLGRALRAEPIAIWGDGSVVRDYVHADDVARAFVRAARHVGPHRVFNIGSGAGVSLLSLVEAIETLVGHRLERRHLPARGFDVPANVLDIARAAAYLDWRPEIGFRDGLHRTLAWLAARSSPGASPVAPA